MSKKKKDNFEMDVASVGKEYCEICIHADTDPAKKPCKNCIYLDLEPNTDEGEEM